MVFAVTTFSIEAIPFLSFGKVPPSAPNSSKQAVAENKFAPEKSEINGDLANIRFHQEQITRLKKQCDLSAKENNKMALAMNKKALAKAEADLARDKDYLRADKADLKRDHRLAISEQREAVSTEKKNLSAARKKLNSDLSRNSEASDKAAMAVVNHQRMLNSKEAALKNEKESRHSDILAINRQIKKANAQPGVTLYAENAVANTKDWIKE